MNWKSVFTFSLLATAITLCSAKGTKTFYVADRKVACAGTYECIQVREKSNAQWRVFSDTIQGFNYEEGFEYKISVEEVSKENKLNGMYEEKYKVLKVIAKKKTDFKPSEKLPFKKWVLKAMNDGTRNLGLSDTSVFIEFNLKTGKTRGRALCNNFTTSFSCKDSNISITDLTSTKMMCKGEKFEGVIFSFYKKATTFKVQGNTLWLNQPGGEFLEFEAR